MLCAGHVTGIGEIRNEYNILVGISEGRGHMGNLDKVRKMILKLILEKEDMGLLTGFIWFR
jgi:hypothetical protein